MHARLGLTWQVSDLSGWGVFGWNLVSELLARGRPRPLLLVAPNASPDNERFTQTLAPLAAEQARLAAMTAGRKGAAVLPDTLLLHHLGNALQLAPVSRRFQGAANVGVVFFESTRLGKAALRQARRFDRIVAGSSWNGEVLRSHGLEKVEVVLQGIDPTLFHPTARPVPMFPGRFVVFSGGKLEFRKGQDIVLAAFRAFRRRHPEALLITLWHNLWPQSSDSLKLSPHVDGPPGIGPDGRQKIAAWAAAHGLDQDAFRDLGLISNAGLAAILHQADAAVFPNRCEGGTNLVAMECLACGVPTVLSANTGHRDLIAGGDLCYPLIHQGPVAGFRGNTEGWGETPVDELVDALEQIHVDRGMAAAKAARGADFMTGLSWRRQIDKLLAALGETGPDGASER